MKMRTILWLPLWIGLALTAPAAVYFSDGFDAYAAGSNLHGQGGWKGWDNVAAAGAIVSTDYAFSGSQSVNVSGPTDLVHEFACAGGQWEVSIDQYIPPTASGTTYLILLNTYSDGGADNSWSVQIPIDIEAGTAGYELREAVDPLTVKKDQWANWTFKIDLDANTVGTYYNGNLWTTQAWQIDGANSLAAIDLYANGATPVYYDNLTVVPEPTTLVGLSLLLSGALMRRRRD